MVGVPILQKRLHFNSKSSSYVTLGTAVVYVSPYFCALISAQLAVFFLWVLSKFAQTEEKCVARTLIAVLRPR